MCYNQNMTKTKTTICNGHKCDRNLLDLEVFYINIGNLPTSEIDTVLKDYIVQLNKQGIDTTGVLVTPTRTFGTGWASDVCGTHA